MSEKASRLSEDESEMEGDGEESMLSAAAIIIQSVVEVNTASVDVCT